MTKSIHILYLCLFSFLLPNISTGQLIYEGFETNTCENPANAFYEGCFPGWISISGTADIYSNTQGITPFEGSKYVHMYSSWKGWTCPTEPNRSESIALNYDFQSGQTYTVKCKVAWDGPPSFPSRHIMKTDFILTNNRANQYIPGTSACSPGDILPPINPHPIDRIIGSKNMPNNQFEWVEVEFTFNSKGEFNQLWIRPETLSNGFAGRDLNSNNHVYLDAFEIETCVNTGLVSNFSLSATGNGQTGNVTVNTTAFQNTIPVNHWWDVFYAPNGSTSGNTEVPGNPIQCCTSPMASFSNNLVINTWYYIKHGVWQPGCRNWRETRKRFRVQIMTQTSGTPKYKIEIEDVKFEPSLSYQSSMIEMVSKFSDEEIEFHNQRELQLITESPGYSILNYPNPFNTTTTIEFNLEKEQAVSLYVYDFTGKQIATLLENETKSIGKNQVNFDGSNLANGIYFYTILSDGFKETKKMILSK